MIDEQGLLILSVACLILFRPSPGRAETRVFEVADLDAFVKTLKGKSVTFVMDILETPVCRMAVISDPDGNHITIHKRK